MEKANIFVKKLWRIVRMNPSWNWKIRMKTSPRVQTEISNKKNQLQSSRETRSRTTIRRSHRSTKSIKPLRFREMAGHRQNGFTLFCIESSYYS